MAVNLLGLLGCTKVIWHLIQVLINQSSCHFSEVIMLKNIQRTFQALKKGLFTVGDVLSIASLMGWIYT